MRPPRQQSSLRRRPTSLRFESLEPRLALAADITTGLVHYWTFDETTGDTAHDIAGASDGTLVNWSPTEPKWEPGRVGGALRFDSADNYVIAPNPGMTGSFALSFWLNASDRSGAFARIVTPKNGNVVAVANELGRGVGYTQNDDSFTYSAEPPTFNTWEHYAINFNNATKQAVIYRSGAPVAIGAFDDSASAASWILGHSYDLNNGDHSLRGALDDFRVYDRVLKDEDVAELASMGVPEQVHQEPVHHWTFDETTGFTAHDDVGGANGTLINWNQTEPRWVAGKVNGALAFTTSDNAVVTPAVSTTGQWSVAFWVDVTAHTGINPRVIEPWAYIRFDNNQGMGFSYANQNTFDDVQVQLNKWEHYVITFDATLATGTIYRNGIAVKSGFLGGNAPAFPLVIGHNQDLSNPNDSLNGLLDDLRIYDRALTAGEVQRLVSGPAVVSKDDSYTAFEDSLLTIAVDHGVLINDSDLDATPQAALAVDAVHGAVLLASDGSFTYQPTKDYHGPDSFSYKLTDNRDNTAFATVSLTVNSVNDAPTFTSGPDIEVSDELAAAAQLTNISFDDLTGAPDNLFYGYTQGDFTVGADSGRWLEAHDPSHITGDPAPAIYGDTASATLGIKRKSGGSFALSSFDLASWEFGFSAIDSPVQYTVEGYLNGQLLYSSTGQVSTSDFKTINDLPGGFVDMLRFNMVRIDSQAYILDNIRLVTPTSESPGLWATNISPGPADESSQLLNFVVTTDKPELFLVQPAIDPSGRLTFIPKANTDGLATISVSLHDDGGTALGGIDTSPVQTFQIHVVKQHPWHNVASSNDVDGDSQITASDVIAVINYINAGRPGDMFTGQPGEPYGFLDVDADDSITANDVITVINVINAAKPKPAAVFVTTDTTTQGNWIGNYGSGGYSLNSGPMSLSDYVQMSFKSGLTEIYDYVTADSNDDVQALQLPGTDDRLLATWTGDYGFVLDLNLHSSQPHRVALYLYPASPRSQRLEVINADTGAVLDTRTLENLSDGTYLVWNITGHVKIRFINIANGLNAILNGVFFD